jgi:hypothetical protein
MKLLDCYEATTYAVIRTDAALKVFDRGADIPSPMFWELFTTLAPLGIGKHVRLQCVYLARSAGAPFESVKRKQWHPELWSRDDPTEMSAHFVNYLKTLAEFIPRENAATITWRDLATVHRNFFRRQHVDLMLTESGDPQFSTRPALIFEKALETTRYHRKRLILEEGDLRLRLGLFSEIPTKVLEDMQIYCSSKIHLSSVSEVISDYARAVALPSRLMRLWRISRSAAPPD